MDKGWCLGAFPFAYCKQNVWGAVFGHIFSPILALFSIVEMPKGWSWMILEHSGSMGKTNQ